MKDEIKKLLFDFNEVEREFEIVGEALKSILKISSDFPFKNTARIVTPRNRVIHGYDKVGNVNIWGIINRDLAELKSEVTKLLNE